MKYIITCQHCNMEFEGKRSTATYCSPSCRQMAYVKRSNQQYQPVNQLADQRQSTLPLISVNKTVDTVNLPSTRESNTTAISSTNEAYTSSYRQSTVNNYHQQDQQEPVEPVDEYSFIDEMNIKDANWKLKCWVEDLLEFDANRKIYRNDISDLSHKIEVFLSCGIKRLPKNYPHRNFIINILKPRIDKLLGWTERDNQSYYSLEIIGDFKRQLIETLESL